MIQRLILVGLVAFLGAAVGCGSSDESAGGGGGAAGGGGGGGGGGGEGGIGGEGGAGGEVGGPTPLMDRTDAGLIYQLECCQCQAPGQCHDLEEPISESACLALTENPPFSDRQNSCFDAVILGEELMTLANRFACLIEADLTAADCLFEVSGCEAAAITDCLGTRAMMQANCPTPQADVIPMTSECFATVTEDGVDAFLDSRLARCDCLTNCMPADPEPDVVQCMEDTLQAEVDMLGPDGPTELKCITDFWRQTAICFGNEVACDGAVTACSELPLTPCAISGAILDDCLAL